MFSYHLAIAVNQFNLNRRIYYRSSANNTRLNLRQVKSKGKRSSALTEEIVIALNFKIDKTTFKVICFFYEFIYVSVI